MGIVVRLLSPAAGARVRKYAGVKGWVLSGTIEAAPALDFLAGLIAAVPSARACGQGGWRHSARVRTWANRLSAINGKATGRSLSQINLLPAWWCPSYGDGAEGHCDPGTGSAAEHAAICGRGGRL
jgi:hypothetical protein